MSKYSQAEVTCVACHGDQHTSASDVAKVKMPAPDTCATCHSTQVEHEGKIRARLGSVGTALLRLGKLAGMEMFGTCSAQAAEIVKELGGTPLITAILTSSEKSTALPVTVWMAFSTASVGTTYGVRAKRYDLAARVVVYGFQAKLHGRKNAFGRAERATPDSRIRHAGAVHHPKLVSAWSQKHGALQYPVVYAAEARVVPP